MAGLYDVIKTAAARNAPAPEADQTSALASRARQLANFSRSSASPLEQMVLAEGGRRSVASVVGELDSATNRANNASTGARGIYERQTRALGQTQSAEAQRSANRRIGLSRALVSVDARNRAVQGLRDRTDIARSAAADLRSMTEGMAFDAQSQSAGMAADREIQYQQELAEYKQKKAAGLGQLASMAAMFIPGVGPFVSPMIGQAVTKAAL